MQRDIRTHARKRCETAPVTRIIAREAMVRTHLLGAAGTPVNVSHNATCRPLSRASMNRPTIAMRGSRPLSSRVHA